VPDFFQRQAVIHAQLATSISCHTSSSEWNGIDAISRSVIIHPAAAARHVPERQRVDLGKQSGPESVLQESRSLRSTSSESSSKVQLTTKWSSSDDQVNAKWRDSSCS
jgi:hypothetical protein